MNYDGEMDTGFGPALYVIRKKFLSMKNLQRHSQVSKQNINENIYRCFQQNKPDPGNTLSGILMMKHWKHQQEG